MSKLTEVAAGVKEGLKEVVTQENVDKALEAVERLQDAATVVNASGVIPSDKQDNVAKAVKDVGFVVKLIRAIVAIFKK